MQNYMMSIYFPLAPIIITIHSPLARKTNKLYFPYVCIMYHNIAYEMRCKIKVMTSAVYIVLHFDKHAINHWCINFQRWRLSVVTILEKMYRQDFQFFFYIKQIQAITGGQMFPITNSSLKTEDYHSYSQYMSRSIAMNHLSSWWLIVTYITSAI